MYQEKTVGAVVLAAGKSSRANGKINKLYRHLSGKPVLYYSLDRFTSSELVDEVVVVYNRNDLNLLQDRVMDKMDDDITVTTVAGGERRQDSSWAGLNTLKTDYVFVHDGARPNFSSELLYDLLVEAVTHGACFPGLKPVDTIRKLHDGLSGSTVGRDSLVRVQTPQCFNRKLLAESIGDALENNRYYTDDAGAVLDNHDITPRVVPGEKCNIKLTTNEDFAVIEALMAD